MDKIENAVQTPKQGSVFISVIAWVFIIIAGFLAVMGVMESIVFSVMFPISYVAVPMDHMKNAVLDPATLKHISHTMTFAAICFAVVNLILLATSIGLFKRMKLARIFFIVFMAVGIIFSLILIVFLGIAWRGMSAHPAGQSIAHMHLIDLFSIFAMSCSIIICVLFAWIIKRLASKDIRQEFTENE